jgi:hypothetical protein
MLQATPCEGEVVRMPQYQLLNVIGMLRMPCSQGRSRHCRQIPLPDGPVKPHQAFDIE